jgi:GNAT superfamily N-acetyltransferase
MPQSDQPEITIEDAPSQADIASVSERLYAYNIAATGHDDYRPLGVFARDATGAIIAGLLGSTWAGLLRIEILWVDERLRKQGYGSRLLAAAERLAVARGCQTAHLDTFSFQAPDYYPKLGYTLIGQSDNTPPGHTHYFFTKRLG